MSHAHLESGLAPSQFVGLLQTANAGRVGLRRRPVQRRSRFACAAILEALSILLQRQTFEECTSNQIAAVAGVGIGTFYEYFSNKETVLAVWLQKEYAALRSPLEMPAAPYFDSATQAFLGSLATPDRLLDRIDK